MKRSSMRLFLGVVITVAMAFTVFLIGTSKGVAKGPRDVNTLDPALNIETYEGHDVAARQVMVGFTPEASQERKLLIQYLEDADITRPVGGAGAVLIHSRSKGVAELLRDLTNFAEITYAEPDPIARETKTPNDTDFTSQWGLNNTGQIIEGQAGTPGADIKAESAWGIATGSANYVVGMVDSGIYYSHPDLAANIWSAPKSFTVTVGGVKINCASGTHGFDAITNSCLPLDDDSISHGTHTAGTVGAVGNNALGVTGVNWTTRLMGLKFLGSNGVGTTSNAINSIEFAIQAELVLGVSSANVRVLNNSWGSNTYSISLLNEVNRAASYDMLFVAAAGNSGTNNDVTPVYPASYGATNELAVAATDNKDNLASFSDYGDKSVNLGAPGVGILSTLIGGTYGNLDGTSMSTAFVSGAGALILSACALDATTLRATILDNIDAVASLSGKTTTGGRLDAYKALKSCTSGASGSGGIEINYRVCPVPLSDYGYITFNVDSLPKYTFDYSNTPEDIADGLAYTINADPNAIVSATATITNNFYCPPSGQNLYNAHIALVAKAKGALTNYSYSVSLFDTQYPNNPTFVVSTDGPTFTGGH